MWQELQPDDPGRIGPYRLRGVLGSGGMGRVFLGASVDGDLAAVKVIRADLASDPEFRARFRREVTVARKVSSRFTAPLIGADTDGPMPWLATAYVAGPSLADAVTQHGPLPVRSVRELVAGLATGLSAIHAAGVVHRDLKPSNVLLAQDGPRVIDFGISVAAETSPLTRTGLLIGSPGYMSPEQIEGREVGPASDIFSLGAVLAYAATGEAPFGRGSAPTLAYRAVYRQVNLDRVPAEVRGLIQRCLAKDPGQRPTARDLEFAAGASVIPPTERWLPEPVTRTSVALPGTDKSSQTVTSARLSPASPPAPGRRGRHGSRRQRRLARPLTIASMVVGLLAASAAGGIALAASAHQTPGAHSGQAVSGSVTPPAASAPATSAASMPATMAPSTPATAPASAGATPTASPSAVMSPSASPTASAAGTPTASSSPAPTAPASASTSPAPSGSAVPSGAAAPSGAAVTPAS